MDYNSKYLDHREKILDARIKGVYIKARKELEKSLADFVKQKDRMSKAKLTMVNDGKMSIDEYKEWLRRAVFRQQQWEQKVEHCTRMISESNNKALAIIRGEQYNVYTEGANHQAYEVEKRAHFQPDISFEIYDMGTVEKLIEKKPALLPPKKINGKKDRAWNQGIISNCVTEGIIQGESIDKIAARIARETQRQNDASMVRYARTALTAAQNAGRIDTMTRTKDMGIRVKKKWLATLDRKTRHSHQILDGQEEEINRPFKSILGKIMYPGDPEAEPGDVYNCRCTLEYVYPDFEGLAENVERYDQENGEVIEDMTYSDWKEWKKGQPKKEKPKKKPKEELPLLDKIKQRISEHEGEWELDDVISVGKDVSDFIEQEAQETVNAIEAEIQSVLKRLKEFEDNNDYSMEWADLFDKKFELMRKKNKVRSEAVLNALKRIRNFGGVTKETVDGYADFDYYTYKKSAVKENMMDALNCYPSSWLEYSKRYRTSLKPHWSTQRAYYSPGNGEIRTSDRMPSNLHELGHRMESCVPGVIETEREFYKRRTEGYDLEWLGHGYDRSEKARKDKFTDPYMGKDYGGEAFELVSMGFESVLAPNPRHRLDDEMRHWILGILSAL